MSHVHVHLHPHEGGSLWSTIKNVGSAANSVAKAIPIASTVASLTGHPNIAAAAKKAGYGHRKPKQGDKKMMGGKMHTYHTGRGWLDDVGNFFTGGSGTSHHKKGEGHHKGKGSHWVGGEGHHHGGAYDNTLLKL